MIRTLLALTVLLLLSGCEIDRQKATVMEQKQQESTAPAQKKTKSNDTNQTQLLRIKQQGAIELEKLKAQNEQKLESMRLEAKEKELAVQQRLAKSEHNLTAATHEQNVGLYKTAIVVFALLAVLIAVIWYFIARANRRSKEKMQEQQMRHEANMKSREFYQQRINKLLDIAASKDSDSGVKEEAMKMLKNDSSFKTIEFKDD